MSSLKIELSEFIKKYDPIPVREKEKDFINKYIWETEEDMKKLDGTLESLVWSVVRVNLKAKEPDIRIIPGFTSFENPILIYALNFSLIGWIVTKKSWKKKDIYVKIPNTEILKY